jgi:uncharacterized protein
MEDTNTPDEAEATTSEPSSMQELIEYVAKSLVENPEEVAVTEEWDGYRFVVHLDVAESDMGKVIGRGGRVAEAMRSLLKVAAARQDARAVLDIGD